jgi:hypothetical protein
VLLHADPVAQDRAAGERAGRVDGEHAHPVPLFAQLGDERVGGRRLAHARRAGQPHHLRPAGVRRERGGHLGQQLVAVFDERDQAGDRARVTLARRGDQRRDVTTSAKAHAPASLRSECARAAAEPDGSVASSLTTSEL